jgi:hypothetical protein
MQLHRHADSDCVYRGIVEERSIVSRAPRYLELIRDLVEAIRIGICDGDDSSVGEGLERREMPLSSYAATSDQTYSYWSPLRCHIKLDQFLPVRS